MPRRSARPSLLLAMTPTFRAPMMVTRGRIRLNEGETMREGKRLGCSSKSIAVDRGGARRRLISTCVAVACLVLIVFASGSSAALDRVASGSLTLTSDPGDYVGGGQSYSFASPADVFQAASDATNGSVSIRETSPQFDHNWELDLSAPSGQQLTPGVYSGAAGNAVRDL